MYNLLCTAAAVSNLNPNPNTEAAAALDYKCVKLLPAIQGNNNSSIASSETVLEKRMKMEEREREWAG